jgi:hypothetical protein
LVIDDIDAQWAGIILRQQTLDWLSDDIRLIAGGNDDGDASLHSLSAEIAKRGDTSYMPEIAARCDQVDPYDAGERGYSERDHGFVSDWTTILQCIGKIPAQAKLERGTLIASTSADSG